MCFSNEKAIELFKGLAKVIADFRFNFIQHIERIEAHTRTQWDPWWEITMETSSVCPCPLSNKWLTAPGCITATDYSRNSLGEVKLQIHQCPVAALHVSKAHWRGHFCNPCH